MLPPQMNHLACGAGGGVCSVCEWGVSCSAGTCTTEIASGQQFYIAVASVVVVENNAGTPWDATGGLPDPYVCFNDGTVGGCTSVVSDSTTGTWLGGEVLTNASGAPVLFSSDAIRAGLLGFSIYDQDVVSDDFIGGGEYSQGIFNKEPIYIVTNLGNVVELQWWFTP